ncbi:hypothetical protein AAF712_013660 [Marasmius tenuissimus]|uniref:Cytochrome P450 n=1 Tax=Marasmius tenuissimus TaxID=585030 RepID=A0ABR2ZF86_9AGAR
MDFDLAKFDFASFDFPKLDLSSLNYRDVGIAVGVSLAVYRYFRALRERSKLSAIPTYGYNGIFTSYLTVWRYLSDPRALYPDTPFKIPTTDGWYVVLHGDQMYEAVRRASEDELSVFKALDNLFKVPYTISSRLNDHPQYHINTILTSLTRSVNTKFDEIRDEVQHGFETFLPANDHGEWVKYTDIPSVAQKIVVRVTNRVFVGLPLCRNEDWCDLNIKFTISVAVNGMIIGMFPEFLHPIVGRIFSSRNSSFRRARKHMMPLIEERLEMVQKYGTGVDYEGKPNDLISWLLDECARSGTDWQKGEGLIEELILRMVATNFGAIHTTSESMTLSSAIYFLAANPHLAEPLRAEINECLEQEGGWTKVSLGKMNLVDSFLKESGRKSMVGAIGVLRIVDKEFVLPNGTTLPVGARVGLAAYESHHNKATYPSPEEFNYSRFVEMGNNVKNLMTTPSEDWMVFGAGRHACPGRFFAVNMLKLLLGHLLLNYDVKLPDGAKLPEPTWLGSALLPNTSAGVLFRKRM